MDETVELGHGHIAIGDHREGDLLPEILLDILFPAQVGVDTIDREPDALYVAFLEFWCQTGELDEFGRAHWREIRRVRKQQHPFAGFGELRERNLTVGAHCFEVRSWIVDAGDRLS